MVHEGALLVQRGYPSFLFDRALRGASEEGTARAALRVLIVEDESLVALDIEAALSSAGFVVVGTVDTEREAVRAAQRLEPDVVIMDITLRDGDGISAARAIGNSCCVIFVTGNADAATVAAAERVGPAAFVHKPFGARELARAVVDACKQRDLY